MPKIDTITPEALELHRKWLNDDPEGVRIETVYLADLRGADLRGAYLSGADLSGAYLTRADLTRAKGILAIGPIGSRGDTLYAVQHESAIMLKTGCFWGTLEEFVQQVSQNHRGTPYQAQYLAAVDTIRTYFGTPDPKVPLIKSLAELAMQKIDRSELPDWVEIIANGNPECWQAVIETAIADMEAEDADD